MHGLQSFVSTHSEESDSLIFILFAKKKKKKVLNICISEREFRYLFRGVCLGVESVHHCHQEVKS